MRELVRIELGGTILREGERVERPSLYIMQFSWILKEDVTYVEVHDFWLVDCFLFPFFSRHELLEKSRSELRVPSKKGILVQTVSNDKQENQSIQEVNERLNNSIEKRSDAHESVHLD